MDAIGVLREALSRVPDGLRCALDGVSPEQLATAPSPGANTLGWLGWHIGRGQDAQVAALSGEEQVATRSPRPARPAKVSRVST